MPKPTTKTFRIAAISTNPNAFGLYGFCLIAADGEAWEVGGNHLKHRQYALAVADPETTNPTVTVHRLDPDADADADWAFHGWEIPRRLSDAPPAVLATLFPADAA